MAILFGDDDELLAEIDDVGEEDFACLDCANGVCDYHVDQFDDEDTYYFGQ